MPVPSRLTKISPNARKPVINTQEKEEVEETENIFDQDAVEECNIANEKNEDLFTVSRVTIEPKIPEGEHQVKVSDVTAERMSGLASDKAWIKITIKFKFLNPISDECDCVNFYANKSLNPKGRLYPVLKGILSSEPDDNFNLKELIGRRAIITIKHIKDNDGNIWANVVAAKECS